MFNRIKNFFRDITDRIKSEMAFRKRMKDLKSKDPFIYK